MARLDTGDAVVPAIELACDGSRVAVGIQARAAPNVRAVPLAIAGDGDRPIAMTLGRPNAMTSFSGYITDNRLLAGLAGGWSRWRLSVGGRALAPPIAGAAAVIREALARCEPLSTSPARSQPTTAGLTDEESVRADVAKIYGFRDGRPIRGEADFGKGHFSPRIEALIAACENASASAGTKPDGTGAYDIIGDQGCGGDVFGTDESVSDNTDFSKIRVTLQRRPDGAIDAKVAPQGLTLQYRRIGDRWLIDEAVTVYEGKRSLYSDTLREQTAEIMRLPRARRKRS